MFRYIAAVWRPGSHEQCSVARVAVQRLRDSGTPWTISLEHPGITVYCLPDQSSRDGVVRIDGCCGVILGTLFESAVDTDAKPRRVEAVSRGLGGQISESFGQSLVSSHWGSYVLFLKDHHRNRVCVFSGPASRLPCFHSEVRGVMLFFSCVDDLLSLRLVRPSINFDSIRAQATSGDYLTAETAINEIGTILPGQALELTAAGAHRKVYWSPRLLAKSRPVATLDDAVTLMESRTRACVSAWSSLHTRVLVTLSGGVDSSVVSGYLHEAPHRPDVTAINFFDRAAGDERGYARSMARRTGFELVEREMDSRVDFRKFLDCALTAAPVLHMTAVDLEPTCIRLAVERGATAIFTGELGDDIFGRAVGPEVVADSIWRFGIGRTLLRAAADYAEFKRLSVWNTLSQGFRYRSLQSAAPYWSIYRYQKEFAQVGSAQRLVTDEVITEYERTLSRFIHPWLQDVSDVPPGWIQLIYGLMMTTSTWSHSPFGGEHESMFVHPLCSQPLVEAYARIPAKFHMTGGHSGAVARRAFAELLSTEVLKRGRSKGTPEIWLIDMVERNRAFLREFLLDGILVRERILDKKKLEFTISRELGKSQIPVAEVIVEMYIEAWLRRWTEVKVRAAA